MEHRQLYGASGCPLWESASALLRQDWGGWETAGLEKEALGGMPGLCGMAGAGEAGLGRQGLGRQGWRAWEVAGWGS